MLVVLSHRYHTHPRYLPYPAKHVSIRGIEEEKYSIVDVTRMGRPGGTAQILEEIELSRALFEIYEGAVVCSGRTSPACITAYLVVLRSLFIKASLSS